jgi:malate dehydrogenase
MSRMDLLEVNARIVKGVVQEIVAGSPDCVIIVVTNPLDHMTTLAADISGFPKSRVMGQAGILDSSRFAHFISEATGADIQTIRAVTLGSHGETMVPVPSLSRVGDRPLTDVLDADTIEELVVRTRNGGAEIVGLLKTGSAYFAPSAAATAMVRAVLTDSGEEMPVCAWMTGQYGINDVYLGVEAKIGAGGVQRVDELPVNAVELAELREAAEAVKAKVSDLEQIELE